MKKKRSYGTEKEKSSSRPAKQTIKKVRKGSIQMSSFLLAYPKATSRIIIKTNPMPTPMVEIFECFPL